MAFPLAGSFRGGAAFAKWGEPVKARVACLAWTELKEHALSVGVTEPCRFGWKPGERLPVCRALSEVSECIYNMGCSQQPQETSAMHVSFHGWEKRRLGEVQGLVQGQYC